MAENDMNTQQSVKIEDVNIRVADECDLEEIYELWKTGGWHEFGRETLKFMFDQDMCRSRGFVAEYQGQIIGVGFAFAINDKIGELCGLFVRPGYRKFGVGRKIWDARIEYLGDRNISVYGLNERAKTDMKLGFTHKVEEISVFYGDPMNEKLRNDLFIPDDNVDQIIPLRDADFEKLIAYDRSFFRGVDSDQEHPIVDRRQHLKHYIQKYPDHGFVACKSGEIVGYLADMPSDSWAVAGPWYAESPAAARALLQRYACALPPSQDKLHFLVPDSNQAARDWMAELGFQVKGLCYVLFNKEKLTAPWHRIYSCRTFLINLW